MAAEGHEVGQPDVGDDPSHVQIGRWARRPERAETAGSGSHRPRGSSSAAARYLRLRGPCHGRRQPWVALPAVVQMCGEPFEPLQRPSPTPRSRPSQSTELARQRCHNKWVSPEIAGKACRQRCRPARQLSASEPPRNHPPRPRPKLHQEWSPGAVRTARRTRRVSGSLLCSDGVRFRRRGFPVAARLGTVMTAPGRGRRGARTAPEDRRSADIAVCGEVLRADDNEHCTGGEAGDPTSPVPVAVTCSARPSRETMWAVIRWV